MLTEEQAKTKWCPFVRQLGTLVGRRDATQDDRTVAMGSQNRGYSLGGPLDNCRCIASECMAWRWMPLLNGAPLHEIAAPRGGFCGLSGIAGALTP